MVYLYFIYCIEVWSITDNCIIDPLFKVQKRMVRLICHVSYTYSTTTLFPMLNILSLSSIYNLKLGLLMYKVHLVLQPISVLRLFHVNIEVHNHDTRQKKHFHTPVGKTYHIYKSFYFQSINLWNQILSNISIEIK